MLSGTFLTSRAERPLKRQIKSLLHLLEIPPPRPIFKSKYPRTNQSCDQSSFSRLVSAWYIHSTSRCLVPFSVPILSQKPRNQLKCYNFYDLTPHHTPSLRRRCGGKSCAYFHDVILKDKINLNLIVPTK